MATPKSSKINWTTTTTGECVTCGHTTPYHPFFCQGLKAAKRAGEVTTSDKRQRTEEDKQLYINTIYELDDNGNFVRVVVEEDAQRPEEEEEQQVKNSGDSTKVDGDGDAVIRNCT